MAKSHKKICYEDRLKIKELINEGNCGKKIADIIGVHKMTIYREFDKGGGTRENKFRDYDPDIAQKSVFSHS